MKLAAGLVYKKRYNPGLLVDLDNQILPHFNKILDTAAKNHDATVVFGPHEEWCVNKYSFRPVTGAQYILKDEATLNSMRAEIIREFKKFKQQSKKPLLQHIQLNFGVVK